MITAIITDTHFGARNDSTAFSNYFAKFYNDIFFPYLKKHDIKHVIHMGDVFDRRKFINYKTLYDARNYFFNPLRDNGLQCWMLAGNHDTFYKTTNEVNSVGLLLQEYDNIQVFDTAVEMENCVLMPWVCSGNYEESIDLIKNT